ncbi:hypothetical protein roselon_00185 [Roseibacterium elongatum DSM 19469]|uniref:Uncharacterized protein n=1 Tax=Roseicyclus elongatus DSM 19469 TaxID=1294273 RepID=W8RXT9_9RHOB|nr:hypothetical protein [Roseibacterium elongatum]AHM02642.1 hypothetical protein roselon_00185 [Roseibacterium elongatum DSM 19469]
MAMRGLAALMAMAMVVAGPAVAEPGEVALERTVSDADRGLRAIIRYRPEVMTGGREEIEAEDGSVAYLYWDGLMGQFSAEIIEGQIAGGDAEAFLREAVIAVCPSVEQSVLATAPVQVDGRFLRIFAQCLDVDADYH